MRSKGWGPNPTGFLPLSEEERREISPGTGEEERPCELTAEGACLHPRGRVLSSACPASTLLSNLQPQDCEKINVCYFSLPVCGIVLR